jgi:hypothetical protein
VELVLVTPEELARVIGLPPTDLGIISSAAASNEVIGAYLTPNVDHAKHASDREAALSVAVTIFQNRTASGGQSVGLDYTPTPFRIGAALLSTVQGLLGICFDQRSEIG